MSVPSSFTMVTMLDTRLNAVTVAMPRTTDILNRVITFKDIYGSANTYPITLTTSGGDVFENGTTSLVLSNAFDTVTFHAGLPGRWHRTAGTNIVGGITASSTFTNSLSSGTAFISNISSAGVFGKFFGDGSELKNLPNTFSGTVTFGTITVSNVANIATLSTNFITASNISANSISTNFAYLSNVSTNLLGAVTANINTLTAGTTNLGGGGGTGTQNGGAGGSGRVIVVIG